MAKAKKTESAETPEKKAPVKAAAPKASMAKAAASPPASTPAAEKKAPAKKAPVKAAAGKKSAPTPVAGTPLVDTALAAQNAAAMLLNRPATPAASQPSKESSAFKNLKDQLAKPKPSGLSNLFGPTGDPKKAGGHFNLHQQKGHNQTFGGLNKAGVPRRTNG
jgi:hypothetical protein